MIRAFQQLWGATDPPSAQGWEPKEQEHGLGTTLGPPPWAGGGSAASHSCSYSLAGLCFWPVRGMGLQGEEERWGSGAHGEKWILDQKMICFFHQLLFLFNQELHNSKSELVSLYNELQNLRGAAEERDFLSVTHEKLQHENTSLETKVSELSQECEQLNQLVVKQKIDENFTTTPSVFSYLSGERLLQQHQEEMQQLRQDFHRVQNLCSSAEKELRYEREKNLDLKKHNILLQQENTKVKAELRQVQLKLTDSTKMCSSLTVQWEHSQQKVKELELELLKHSQSSKLQSSLQEKLALEKSRATDAEKKVLELQQKLKESHHQLRLTETHVLGRKQMEEELKEAQERETQLLRQLQEEQRKREILKHASVFQQLHCQKNNQNLSEQLSLLQQEKETLHEEYDRLLKQLDIYVRKHTSEEVPFPNSLTYRVTLVSGVPASTEHEHALIRQITTENENLLQEKRELLQQLNEQEEVGRNNKWIISTIQNRVQFLDEENKRLQESTLQLSSQVGVLERTLRNIQTHSLEVRRAAFLCKMGTSEEFHPSPYQCTSALTSSRHHRNVWYICPYRTSLSKVSSTHS
uniref:Coiled-coil domain containing 30 n=1 Tax=Terrapene triunguis TaxID=2587831 RepID=A0A674KC76_9SAUR